MADTTSLAQGAVEALLDDEALRGDLTDDGFGPLLGWATDSLTALARELAATPLPQAQRRMATAGRAVRSVVAAAVEAAQHPTRDRLRALLAEPLLKGDEAVRARIARAGLLLGGDADANAARLARALQGLRLSAGGGQ